MFVTLQRFGAFHSSAVNGRFEVCFLQYSARRHVARLSMRKPFTVAVLFKIANVYFSYPLLSFILSAQSI